MTRREAERLDDILHAIDVINDYLRRDPELADGMAFDAIRVRLIEIGEAANNVDPELRDTEPDIPWRQIVNMRNELAHRYWDTAHALILEVAANRLPELQEAITRMQGPNHQQ